MDALKFFNKFFSFFIFLEATAAAKNWKKSKLRVHDGAIKIKIRGSFVFVTISIWLGSHQSCSPTRRSTHTHTHAFRHKLSLKHSTFYLVLPWSSSTLSSLCLLQLQPIVFLSPSLSFSFFLSLSLSFLLFLSWSLFHPLKAKLKTGALQLQLQKIHCSAFDQWSLAQNVVGLIGPQAAASTASAATLSRPRKWAGLPRFEFFEPLAVAVAVVVVAATAVAAAVAAQTLILTLKYGFLSGLFDKLAVFLHWLASSVFEFESFIFFPRIRQPWWVEIIHSSSVLPWIAAAAY